MYYRSASFFIAQLFCCLILSRAFVLALQTTRPSLSKNHRPQNVRRTAPPWTTSTASTTPHSPTASSHYETINSNAPGFLRRRLFGQDSLPPKIELPLALVSGLVAALNQTNPLQAIPVFFQVMWDEVQSSSSTNELLPIAYKPFSELEFEPDCLLAQTQARQSNPQPFLYELTPAMCNVDPNNTKEQCQWLQENAERLKELKLSHGAVYLKEWLLFADMDGVQQATKALGGTPCRDPKEIRGGGILSDATTSKMIYETLNNPDDAATHLGLHTENIPGIMPSSALFSCFQQAETGGEFLLCDSRQVFRDLNVTTLANLEARRLRPTFAQLPPWLASPPPPLSLLPFATLLHREVLALFTDMTKPTDDFMLDVFPEEEGEASLKLTTHPAVPVLKHPITREPVWFSGIDAGHQGNFQRDNPHLFKSNKDGRGGKYASEVFDVRYGNGEPISETDLDYIREAYEQHTVPVRMQPGDAIYLDNFITMHGRKPFQGTRKHTVVWSLD